MAKMKEIQYVLSVHWDREWYQSFEEFRLRLLPLLDEILDGLARGELKGPLVCDGQTSPLEDYLYLRPERADEISQHIREGSIEAGAWYVLPDLFQVGGESLIRNIEHGLKSVSTWGGAAPVSLNCCDMFGLNSQVPQIAAGFGIECAYLWRGINKTEARNLIWSGADGTELPCFRFGENGYWIYAVQVRAACDRSDVPDREAFFNRLETVVEKETAATDIDTILLFDGMDHSHWDRDYYRMLVDPASPFRVVHRGLEAFSRRLSSQRNSINNRIQGEQREPGIYDQEEHALLAGTLSSRSYLKRENAACENLLSGLAEPWSLIDGLTGGLAVDDPIFLSRAWDFLLQNQPHDSICGTSIDEVHQDMLFRFRQCRDLAHGVLRRSLGSIARRLPGNSAVDPDRHKLVLFNASATDRPGVHAVRIDLPLHWRAAKYAEWAEGTSPGFGIYDSAGAPVKFQILYVYSGRKRYNTDRIKSVKFYAVDQVELLIDHTLPPCGWSTLTLSRDTAVAEHGVHPQALCRQTPRMIMNELIRAAVDSEGRVLLSDLRTGLEYPGLFAFESEAEQGTPFHHESGPNPDIRTDLGSPFHVRTLFSGELGAALEIRKTMLIPVEYDYKHSCRSDEEVELPITIRLELRKGDPCLYASVAVENNCRDHRLSVLFPTLAKAAEYLSDTPFDLVRRPIGMRKEFIDSFEREVDTHPQGFFTAVAAGSGGLAVVTDGLKEAAVLERPDHPIRQTLIRGYRRFKFRNGEDDSQMQGVWNFPLRILPLEGPPDPIDLFSHAADIRGSVHCEQVGPDQLYRKKTPEAGLPERLSLLRLDGAVLSAFRRRDDERTELRIWNPREETHQARIYISKEFLLASRLSRWEVVDFRGIPVGPDGGLEDGIIRLELPPKAIRTLLLVEDKDER